jgi:hypothetical protein
MQLIKQMYQRLRHKLLKWAVKVLLKQSFIDDRIAKELLDSESK